MLRCSYISTIKEELLLEVELGQVELGEETHGNQKKQENFEIPLL